MHPLFIYIAPFCNKMAPRNKNKKTIGNTQSSSKKNKIMKSDKKRKKKKHSSVMLNTEESPFTQLIMTQHENEMTTDSIELIFTALAMVSKQNTNTFAEDSGSFNLFQQFCSFQQNENIDNLLVINQNEWLKDQSFLINSIAKALEYSSLIDFGIMRVLEKSNFFPLIVRHELFELLTKLATILAEKVDEQMKNYIIKVIYLPHLCCFGVDIYNGFVIFDLRPKELAIHSFRKATDRTNNLWEMRSSRSNVVSYIDQYNFTLLLYQVSLLCKLISPIHYFFFNPI